MTLTPKEVEQFVEEEDVKFIRLAFCDVFGNSKNVSIMSHELGRAFKYGISIDAWSVAGFDFSDKSDLFLHPDPSTLAILPWRPEHGRVVKMNCSITWPDGTPFEADTRKVLQDAVEAAKKENVNMFFGSEIEFYLFKQDENGDSTKIPYDNAGYMDVAPADKGENIRREVCITLEQMGILPESSHHEEGPGQNEIDFRYADPLTAALNALTFKTVVPVIANRNGLVADFSPKPLQHKPGNGLHINFSAKQGDKDVTAQAAAGVMRRIKDITVFLNHLEESYKRLGGHKAPKYVTCAEENRSVLVRIPAANGRFKRAELRSPDPLTNDYLAYALIVYAALEGIKENLELPKMVENNLYHEDVNVSEYDVLPASLKKAKEIAKDSDFVKKYIPQVIAEAYLR